MADELTVEVEDVDGRLVFRPTGDLDVIGGPVLLHAVERAAVSRSDDVEIDLQHVEFLDSSGIQVLVRLNQRRSNGQGLVLRSPRPQARKVLELTGLTNHFGIANGTAAGDEGPGAVES